MKHPESSNKKNSGCFNFYTENTEGCLESPKRYLGSRLVVWILLQFPLIRIHRGLVKRKQFALVRREKLSKALKQRFAI